MKCPILQYFIWDFTACQSACLGFPVYKVLNTGNTIISYLMDNSLSPTAAGLPSLATLRVYVLPWVDEIGNQILECSPMRWGWDSETIIHTLRVYIPPWVEEIGNQILECSPMRWGWDSETIIHTLRVYVPHKKTRSEIKYWNVHPCNGVKTLKQ